MKKGETNIAYSHPDVTARVADLVGFTMLTVHIGPDHAEACAELALHLQEDIERLNHE